MRAPWRPRSCPPPPRLPAGWGVAATSPRTARWPGHGRPGSRPGAICPSACRRFRAGRPDVRFLASASAALRWPEDKVGDAAALVVQLALAAQPVPPGGPQVVVVVLGHAGEADVGHPLAGLPGAEGLLEVLGALPAC